MGGPRPQFAQSHMKLLLVSTLFLSTGAGDISRKPSMGPTLGSLNLVAKE